MIIPQIAENLTRSSNLKIPEICPVCGQEARVIRENDVESLYCMNPDCVAKKIKAFTLFVSRDAMNIDGLSEATLEKFIARGFIHDFGDIFEIGISISNSSSMPMMIWKRSAAQMRRRSVLLTESVL